MFKTATKKRVEIVYVSYEDFCNLYDKKQENWNEKGITSQGRQFKVNTFGGHQVFTNEDVLICGIDGDYYPCKKETFEKIYDY